REGSLGTEGREELLGDARRIVKAHATEQVDRLAAVLLGDQLGRTDHPRSNPDVVVGGESLKEVELTFQERHAETAIPPESLCNRPHDFDRISREKLFG